LLQLIQLGRQPGQFNLTLNSSIAQLFAVLQQRPLRLEHKVVKFSKDLRYLFVLFLWNVTLLDLSNLDMQTSGCVVQLSLDFID
jgi:hypothetical protein